MGEKRGITDDQGDEIAARYRTGESVTLLGEAFHCSPTTVCKALRARGVTIRAHGGPRRRIAGALHGRIT